MYSYAHLLHRNNSFDVQAWRGQFTSEEDFRRWVSFQPVRSHARSADTSAVALEPVDHQPSTLVYYCDDRGRTHIHAFQGLQDIDIEKWMIFADQLMPNTSTGPGRRRRRFLELTDYRTRKFRNDPENGS